MANGSYAKVRIKANKVGAELEDYLKSTSRREYNLLIEWTKSQDGDFTVLDGWGSGRWEYLNTLSSAFNDADTPASEKARDALLAAMKSQQGHISIEFTDHEPAMGVFYEGSAWFGCEPDGQEICFDVSTTDLDRTLANISKAFDVHGADAIADFGYYDLSDEFFEEWTRLHGNARPSLNETEAWLSRRLQERNDAE